MKYPFYFLAILILGSAALPVHGQQQKADRGTRHDHSVYQNIEHAYKQDKLTIDQKVLFKFYAINNPNKLPSEYQAEKGKPIKCGTPAISDFYNNRSQLSKATISEIESLMSSPTFQASETYTSQSGRFVIHYETSGEHAVPNQEYVEKVAASADSSYRHQVQTLGYSDPIPPGDTYHVKIENLDPVYGETRAPSPYGGDTYILIENDFAENFPPNDHPDGNQTGAIYATMAHEFKHAVQYANSRWYTMDTNDSPHSFDWSEMDATLMEEVTYDNVNDYYNYLQSDNSIFLSPTTSIPGAYWHVSWFIYFEEKFGSQFWVDVWSHIRERYNAEQGSSSPEYLSMFDAIKLVLNNNFSTDLSTTFIESHLWHYASGPDNAPPAYGFEESEAYPDPTINYNFFGSDSLNLPENQTDNLQPFSAKYVEVTPSSFSGFVSIELSGINESKVGVGAIAYFNDGTTKPLVLYSENQNSLSFQTTWAWEELIKVGIVVANGNTEQHAGYRLYVRTQEPEIVQLRQNYPNPFSEQTVIQYSIPERDHVQLEVFDILGRKVATLIDQVQPRGIYTETINATDLASGVYFYRLHTGGEVYSEKMTLIK